MKLYVGERDVSVLNREPMWLKFGVRVGVGSTASVSVLNREPMWLKFESEWREPLDGGQCFSAQP